MPPEFSHPIKDGSAISNATVGNTADQAVQAANSCRLEVQMANPASGLSSLSIPPVGADASSPMIQLITRMPGAMGLMNSFFEMLSSFFSPEHLLGHSFDAASSISGHLADGALATLAGSAEHAATSLSLLPADAPIFQTLASQKMAALHIPGQSALQITDKGLLPKAELNVSGTLDAHKPQFEAGNVSAQAKTVDLSGEPLISDAQISNANLNTSLSDGERLFSDNLTKGSFNSTNTTSITSQTQTTGSNNVPESFNVSTKLYPNSSESIANSSNLSTAGGAGDALISGPSLSNHVSFQLAPTSAPSLDSSLPVGPSGKLDAVLGTQSGSEVQAIADTPNNSTATNAPSLSGNSDTASGSNLDTVPSKVSLGQGLELKALKAEMPQAQSTHMAQSTNSGQSIGQANSSHHHSTTGTTGKQAQSHIASKPQALSHKQAAQPHLAKTTQASAHKLAAANGTKAETAGVETTPDQDTQLSQSNGGESYTAQDQTTAHTEVSGTYTVNRGDSLWTIAEKHLGSGSRWQEIYNLNSDSIGQNPDFLRTGSQLKLPGEVNLHIAQAETYVVQPGDNLWSIAKEHLGSGEKWGELYQANMQTIGSNPRLIFPGQELTFGDSPLMAHAPSSQAIPLAHPSSTIPPSQTSTFLSSNTAGTTYGAPSQVIGLTANVPKGFPVHSANMPSIDSGMVQAAGQTYGPKYHPGGSGLVPTSLRPDLSFLQAR
jgi:nucleoid-associated protein YgaU